VLTISPILAAALVLQLHNLAGAPPSVVDTATSELTRVYDELDVHLEWERTAAARVSDREIVRVVLLARETGDLRRLSDTVMGAAVRTANDTRIVYVFYQRVRVEAERFGVSTALVLACAMAHELGHLLMPGRGHSPTGLMRARWNRDDFQRANQGGLHFSRDQVALIRENVLDPPVEHEREERARQ
jgi:hypothetical protein